MSGVLPAPSDSEGESFVDWVQRNRKALEAHAESDYPTGKYALAFLQYADEEANATQ